MCATRCSRKLTLWSSAVVGVALLAAIYCWLPLRTTTYWRRESRSSRPYRVVTRADHDPRVPAPVLIALHAYATAPEGMVRDYLLESLAVRARDYILVIPEGLRDGAGNYAWNASGACCGAGSRHADDLGYLQGLLADVRRDFTLDGSRVTGFGISNGGFMAYRWACSGDGALSSVVSIAGAAPGEHDPPCTLPSPVSVLHIHGEADEVVAYRGGVMNGHPYPSARESLAPFLAAAGAQSDGEPSSAHALLLGDIQKQRWHGDAGSEIALWTVEGGGHRMKTVRTLVLDIFDFLAAPARADRAQGR